MQKAVEVGSLRRLGGLLRVRPHQVGVFAAERLPCDFTIK